MVFISFWDFINYIHDKNMCTRPGCTTCGCVPFRRLCQNEIGYEHMCTLISSVTDEQIMQHNPEEWYEPLRILYDVIFPNLPVDNPLMRRYLEIRDSLLSEIAWRREEARKRVLAEQEQAKKRKEEKIRKAEEHRQRSYQKWLEYHALYQLKNVEKNLNDEKSETSSEAE